MLPSIKTGFVLGTGAALTVSLGWVPDYVRVINVTDGDKIHEWVRSRFCAFTSGGTTEVVAGDTLEGATSGVRVTVDQVILVSGTWAGGDAAGFFVFREYQETGTLGSENVDLLERGDGSGTSQTNVAGVSAQTEKAQVDTDTEVAAVASNGITPYVGASASAAKGFTLGTNVSESGKVLAYIAIRQSAGA